MERVVCPSTCCHHHHCQIQRWKDIWSKEKGVLTASLQEDLKTIAYLKSYELEDIYDIHFLILLYAN